MLLIHNKYKGTLTLFICQDNTKGHSLCLYAKTTPLEKKVGALCVLKDL